MHKTLTFRPIEDELQALREQNELYSDIIAGRGVCRNFGWYDDDFDICCVEIDGDIYSKPMPPDGFCSCFKGVKDND